MRAQGSSVRMGIRYGNGYPVLEHKWGPGVRTGIQSEIGDPMRERGSGVGMGSDSSTASEDTMTWTSGGKAERRALGGKRAP